ncbi:hypothetical protein IF2G_06534 [Cordyceps javanica]|nr:hypothetical protein IF2G_06534 [Cordyceps javanica]
MTCIDERQAKGLWVNKAMTWVAFSWPHSSHLIKRPEFCTQRPCNFLVIITGGHSKLVGCMKPKRLVCCATAPPIVQCRSS